MSLYHAMDASASALTAQRLRLEVTAENIANIQTTRTAQGGPYRRRLVTMAPRAAGGFAASVQQAIRRRLPMGSGAQLAGPLNGVRQSGSAADNSPYRPGGVQVQTIYEDPRPFQRVHDPGHPDADQDGFVELPNVNLIEEMVALTGATRIYEANVTAFNAARHMASRALEIGRG